MAQWPDGTVWIGDRRLAEVSEVSSDGANVRVVLRKGEGPGEVGRARRIDMLPGGGAVVMTGDNYEIFRADKRFDRRQRKLAHVWAWGFVATPEAGFLLSGGYVAPTRVPEGYRVWNDTPDGHYLASYWDDASLQFLAAKLNVAITAR